MAEKLTTTLPPPETPPAEVDQPDVAPDVVEAPKAKDPTTEALEDARHRVAELIELLGDEPTTETDAAHDAPTEELEITPPSPQESQEEFERIDPRSRLRRIGDAALGKIEKLGQGWLVGKLEEWSIIPVRGTRQKQTGLNISAWIARRYVKAQERRKKRLEFIDQLNEEMAAGFLSAEQNRQLEDEEPEPEEPEEGLDDKPETEEPETEELEPEHDTDESLETDDSANDDGPETVEEARDDAHEEAEEARQRKAERRAERKEKIHERAIQLKDKGKKIGSAALGFFKRAGVKIKSAAASLKQRKS
ncbi:MAG TPA: hypothetical protein VIQ80_01460 [Candidatus Saccharimonadales bacterium]